MPQFQTSSLPNSKYSFDNINILNPFKPNINNLLERQNKNNKKSYN